MRCHALFQGIFPTQGLNLCLLHYRWFPLLLSHWGSPQTSMNNLSLFFSGTHIQHFTYILEFSSVFFFLKHLNTFTCYWIYQAKDLQPPNTWWFHLTWWYYQYLPHFHSFIQCVCVLVSHVWLCVTPWTIHHQAPLSMEFSRQEYWSGLPFPSPRDLPNPGIEPGSPTLQVDSLPNSKTKIQWHIT